MKIQHSGQKKNDNLFAYPGARRRNTIAQISILTMMVILLLMVWPFRVFKHSRISDYQSGVVTSETDAVTMEEIVLQPFVPSDTHIADMEIDVNVYGVHGQDRVFVTIYDGAFEIIWQEVVYFADIEAAGIIAVSPELDVIPGQTYYLGMNVHFDSVGTLTAVYGNLSEVAVPELAPFVYANDTYMTDAVLMKFHYTAPFSMLLLLACTAVILFGGAALYVAAVLMMNAWSSLAVNKKIMAKKGALILGVVAAVTGLVIAFVQLCVVKFFGGMALDHGVYATACVSLFVGIGLFAINMWKKLSRVNTEEEKQVDENVKLQEPESKGIWYDTDVRVWKNYLQTLSYVFLIYAGIMYVNATIQWKQDLNAAWIFLLFGISIVVSYTFKELLCVWNLVWSIVMIPTGIAICHMQEGKENGVQIATVFAVALLFWGLVLIRTFRTWNRKKLQGISLLVAVLWLLVCVTMFIAGSEKAWVCWMIPAFTLFYLQYDSKKDCERVIRNFCNGVLINFVMILVLCLLYRPYEYYQFNRYPMWFHTVASTGMYLALVEAITLVRLYVRMRENGTVFRGCVKEWLLHSVVVAYIAFSVARTAIMSVCGIMIVLLIGTMIVYRPKLRRYAQVLLMLVLMLLISIPVCYTATRCIPAVVNEPVFVSESREDFKDAVKKGDAPDSAKYMNFKALMRLWGNRFGLPEVLTRPFADDVSARELYIETDSKMELASAMPGGFDVAAYWESDVNVTQESSQEQTSAMDEMSNGRISIFMMYLKELNWTGHDSMVYVCEDGTMIAHSHNTFIQMAYDFGIMNGVLFLGLCLFVILRAVYIIWKGYDRSEAVFLSLVISCAYLITSISEYVGNPNMPFGFAYLFLLITMRMGKNVVK